MLTWRIIPVSKWLGSPPFVSHLAHLEREQNYLGDLSTHGYLPLTSHGMILPSSQEQISSRDAPFSLVNYEQMVITGWKLRTGQLSKLQWRKVWRQITTLKRSSWFRSFVGLMKRVVFEKMVYAGHFELAFRWCKKKYVAPNFAWQDREILYMDPPKDQPLSLGETGLPGDTQLTCKTASS